MSRAFVKEADGDAVDDGLPERQSSTEPNYVTPRGLHLLHEQARQLENTRAGLVGDETLAAKQMRKEVERDLRYFNARLASAIVVERGVVHTQVGIGSAVEVLDDDDVVTRYGIVGEDEADVAHGLVSWVSPLARALRGQGVGARVTWQRPDGARELEILSIAPL
jgi:transcription elongation factor GreB